MVGGGGVERWVFQVFSPSTHQQGSDIKLNRKNVFGTDLLHDCLSARKEESHIKHEIGWLRKLRCTKINCWKIPREKARFQRQNIQNAKRTLGSEQKGLYRALNSSETRVQKNERKKREKVSSHGRCNERAYWWKNSCFFFSFNFVSIFSCETKMFNDTNLMTMLIRRQLPLARIVSGLTNGTWIIQSLCSTCFLSL